MGYDLTLSPQMLRVMYRRLIIMGFTKEEAGNLLANMAGIHSVQKGWTTQEISRMLFEAWREKQEKEKEKI